MPPLDILPLSLMKGFLPNRESNQDIKILDAWQQLPHLILLLACFWREDDNSHENPARERLFNERRVAITTQGAS
jgi:hypothetical protein